VQQAALFVAVLGASDYTFAEATDSQQLPCWIGSHIRSFEFFGGVPKISVPSFGSSAWMGRARGLKTPPACPAPHSPADTKAILPKDNP
jgi:transposase